MLWLSNQWGDLSDQVSTELLTEKFSLISSKSHEQEKTSLATAIKAAQEAGDIKEIKKLMSKLNELTREGTTK